MGLALFMKRKIILRSLWGNKKDFEPLVAILKENNQIKEFISVKYNMGYEWNYKPPTMKE